MDEISETTLSYLRWSRERGTPVDWESGAAVWTRVDNGVSFIEGNAAGLRALARILLTLAADDVPAGTHVHLDTWNVLEDGSTEIILERSPDPDPDSDTGAPAS